MKRIFAIVLTLVLAVSALTGCGAKNHQVLSDPSTYGQFSYEVDKENYSAGDPGVKTEGFNNAAGIQTYTHTDAAERAKNECTIEWEDVQVDYDADAGVWRVLFYTKGKLGGCQSVYLGLNGETLLIVYGE